MVGTITEGVVVNLRWFPTWINTTGVAGVMARCAHPEKLKFPLNSSFHNVRHNEKFFVQHANCDRLAKSAKDYLGVVLKKILPKVRIV